MDDRPFTKTFIHLNFNLNLKPKVGKKRIEKNIFELNIVEKKDLNFLYI